MFVNLFMQMYELILNKTKKTVALT